jgi:hypothetical protein
VTSAICCSKAKKCPVNKVQNPRLVTDILNKISFLFLLKRFKKDWVCRIDVRRTFGLKTENIQEALNVSMEYLRQNPLEQVEMFFRRGTYKIDSGEKPSFSLKNVRPQNNGRLIIAGAGRTPHRI